MGLRFSTKTGVRDNRSSLVTVGRFRQLRLRTKCASSPGMAIDVLPMIVEVTVAQVKPGMATIWTLTPTISLPWWRRSILETRFTWATLQAAAKLHDTLDVTAPVESPRRCL